MPTFPYFSRDGELVPIDEAVISLSSIEYQYGFGVYETIRVSKGVVYFLEDHIERLFESARIIGLTHSFTKEFIEKSIRDLAATITADTYNLKPLLIGGDPASLYILPLNPRFPEKQLYRDGVHCITYAYERAFPHAKSLNMLQSYLAYAEAKKHNAYDALLINRNGHITEGTRTNFYCLKGKTIVSPPEEEVLLGVTRKALLGVAAKNGFQFEERNISLDDLANYDAAFVTSTSSKVLPVRSIDEYSFGSVPEALKELINHFDTFLETSGGKMTF